MSSDYQFRVYEDQAGDWRWRLVATKNRKRIAVSGESFDSHSNALRAARLVRRVAGHAEVVTVRRRFRRAA